MLYSFPIVKLNVVYIVVTQQVGGVGGGGGVEAEAAEAEVALLAQLTGCPHAEDELLFAVPVVAPYSALVNYKSVTKNLYKLTGYRIWYFIICPCPYGGTLLSMSYVTILSSVCLYLSSYSHSI